MHPIFFFYICRKIITGVRLNFTKISLLLSTQTVKGITFEISKSAHTKPNFITVSESIRYTMADLSKHKQIEIEHPGQYILSIRLEKAGYTFRYITRLSIIRSKLVPKNSRQEKTICILLRISYMNIRNCCNPIKKFISCCNRTGLPLCLAISNLREKPTFITDIAFPVHQTEFWKTDWNKMAYTIYSA